MNINIAALGYSAAAAAFLAFSIALLTVWRQKVRASLLLPASLVACGWGVSFAASGLAPASSVAQIYLTEMIHDSIWLVFLSSLFGGAVTKESTLVMRRGGVILSLTLLFAGLLVEFTDLGLRFPGLLIQLLLMGSISTSLYVLVELEQLYRNARPRQKNGLKLLGMGLGGIFAYDILLYSNAILAGQIGSTFWVARGFVVAFCVPLIAWSIKRIDSLHSNIFASRQVVFYTTTLIAAGLYLTFVGFVGYFLKNLGREWSEVLQLVFLSAAVLGLIALLMSEQIRAKIRVWLTKHFFERKYDYRAEWLRLIHTLTSDEASLALRKRSIKALAQIIGSPSGRLWLLAPRAKSFDVVSSWNTPVDLDTVPQNSPLIKFLRKKNWIIDLKEMVEVPEKYKPLVARDAAIGLADAGFIVPLIHESELIGFVELWPPNAVTSLNYEDHDLLKTAGQQIASYIVQEQATEQLTESRQFEAFNRLTAFIMHDLKNAIAQQTLVVENAKRHKRNPEFVDDAIETIRGSVMRMRRVMGHLHQGVEIQANERIDLTKLLLQVQSQCADRKPVPQASIPETSVIVKGNRDRLLGAFCHAVRNAQDATKADGRVAIDLNYNDQECLVRVTDTGCGMNPTFIREHLFRPFDSTKGAEGMGIGAYQLRETIRASGGDVEVVSTLNEGTILNMRLPLAENVIT